MNFGLRVAVGFLLLAAAPLSSPTAQSQAKPATPTVSELEKNFFLMLRNGDALQLLSYVPEDGVNLGRDAEHATKISVVEQLTKRTGLYCKLFDTACLQATAEGHVPSCSYRELLTHSEKVRTASTETTRNNVRQAILVAEVQNQKCAGPGLIDFIFNYQQGGWKLFSIP